MHIISILTSILVVFRKSISTNITGVINSDFTFSTANSPYYIKNDDGQVIFTNNVIIENGVEIIFPESASLKFKGSVTAGCDEVATTSYNHRGLMDSITFTHIYSNDPSAPTQGYIYIDSSDANNAQISFCNVKFSALGTPLIIVTDNTKQLDVPIMIDNCEFMNNRNIEIIWYYATSSTTAYYTDTIISNTINMVNSHGDAIYDNCEIKNYDIFCESSCLRFAVRNSYISRNETDISYRDGGMYKGCLSNGFIGSYIGDAQLAIYNNILTNCGVGIYTANSASPWIVNNTFKNIHYRAIYFSMKELIIKNNIFQDSKLGSIFYTTFINNVTIIGNKFINNSAFNDSLFYVKARNSYSVVSFVDNLFVDNIASNRFMTVSIRYTNIVNNIFLHNIAGQDSVVSAIDINPTTVAFYFMGQGLLNNARNTVTVKNNKFKSNIWNSYFMYTFPAETAYVRIEFNLFNDSTIGESGKLLSIGSYYQANRVEYNEFMLGLTFNSISAIIESTSSGATIKYNNFFNVFPSTVFMEIGNHRSDITNNYYDGSIDVEAILNKIDAITWNGNCRVIEPFYKDPITMDDINNLPVECKLDSVYEPDCSYNGNIIGCITQTTTEYSTTTYPPSTSTNDKTTEAATHEGIDLVRFTQNHKYMHYELNQGLFMKSNDDTFDFFFDSTFNQVDALNGEIDCYSFHSIHYPDQYIGHNLSNNDPSVYLYPKDTTNPDSITWCHVPALNGNGGITWFPFDYINFLTQHYMKKQAPGDMIIVAQNDGSTEYQDDASFHMWQFDPVAF
eukprot:118726_1